MLFEYKTYLLYDVRIKLESADAYNAINSFLGKVGGDQISHKFLRKVEAHISDECLNLYNDFIILYRNKKFRENWLITVTKNKGYYRSDLEENQEEVKTLEFYGSFDMNNPYEYPCKKCEILNVNPSSSLVKDLSEIKCPFNCIRVVPESLGILFKNKFEFSEEHAQHTKNIFLMILDGLPKNT